MQLTCQDETPVNALSTIEIARQRNLYDKQRKTLATAG